MRAMAAGAVHSDDAANVSAISIAGFILRFRMTWFLKHRRDAFGYVWCFFALHRSAALSG